MDAFTLDITAVAQTAGSAAEATASKLIEASVRDAFDRSSCSELELTSDSPVSIPFAGLDVVTFVAIKPVGGVKVRVRLTSADGSQQAIPVGRALALDCVTVPFTAIDVTRIAGYPAPVRVQYLIGKNAP